ncbi:MAG: rhodanese-like domain-containing protein [Eubacteriaceae bacterium]|nr:rhodanese-like domain-containing protein [Eubacteriaceae bacterium]
MPKKFFRVILALILALGCIAGCSAQKQSNEEASGNNGQFSTMELYNSRFNPMNLSSEEAFGIVASDSSALLIDVRSQASYQDRHVAGAINVPSEDLRDYATANIPDKATTIVFYCFCGDQGGPALSACELMAGDGYTNVFYTDPGNNWNYEGDSVFPESAQTIVSGPAAKKIYDLDPGAILLDVRNKNEYDAGHIKESLLIPVSELEFSLSLLPGKERVIIVYCKAGARSSTAYDILTRNGYSNVFNMQSIDFWPEALVSE